MSSYTLRFTRTAEVCLFDIESFKTSTMGTALAARFVDDLFDVIVNNLEADPFRYRYNIELLELGLETREYLTNQGYRVLYGIDDNVVDVWLILHTRQDIETALWRHMMFR